MILDSGFLIAVDRGEDSAHAFLTAARIHRTPLITSHPVVAHVWRNGARQSRLAKLLRALTVMPFDDGPQVGALLARSGTRDVVDAHLVILAASLNDTILTADLDDFTSLIAALDPQRSHRPRLNLWP